MSDRLIDYVMDQVKEVKQDVKDLEHKMDAKLDEINQKIDRLLAFKWQVIGGSVVVSAIIGIAIQLLSIYGSK